MKLFAAVAVLAGLSAAAVAAEKEGAKVSGPLDFKVKGIDGKEVDLAQYKGKVVLFVNVASECGLTPQYAGLQKLYEAHKDAGLVVIGVPANEFGRQEPGTDVQIKQFCSTKYSVTFPMLSKQVVKGAGISPLYAHLTGKDAKFAGDITWNFEKFLVGRDGAVAARFKPNVEPDAPELTKAVEAELAKK